MKRLIATILLVAVMVSGIAVPEKKASAKEASLSSKKITVTTKQSKTIKVKNTTKKVTWKILSGKKYITLKKNGKTATVTGKKKGTAKVQATVGKTKLTCNVTVKNAKNDTTPEPETTNTPEGTYEQDVTALKELIAQQRKRGATVSEDINSEEYVWKNNKLTEIHWNYIYNEDTEEYTHRNLKGDISFSTFTELEVLECGAASGGSDGNDFTSFDITKNVKLLKLNCRASSLKNLDVSNNVNLVELDCSGNALTSLDVSNNVKLERLEIYRNYELSNLDVSKNINLKYLNCWSNPLTNLDVTKNVQLVELDVRVCNLNSLDVTNNVNLETLYCNGNELSSLDLTNNVRLKVLWCNLNQLSILDLTNNTELTELYCDDNVTVIGYDK